jgi:hypothetical protein
MFNINGEYQSKNNNPVDVLKAEIYRISSFINYIIVDQAFSNRSQYDPYGLVLPVAIDNELPKSFTKGLSAQEIEELRPAIAFHGVEVAFRETLFQSTNRLVNALSGRPQPKLNLEAADREFLSRGWERFCKILPIYAEVAGESTEPPAKDPLAFFKSGVNTGVKPMGLAGVIPRIERKNHEQSLIGQELHQIHRASAPLPFGLASTNRERAPRIIDSLKTPLPSGFLGFFNPDNFNFEEHRPGKRRLRVKPEVEADKKQTLGYWINEPNAISETFGCPGLGRFKNGSAVGILQRWQVMVVRNIYHQLYPVPTN